MVWYILQRRRLLEEKDSDTQDDVLKNVVEQPEYCIDAGTCGSVARFINHSCEPNLFVQCIVNEHHDLSQARVWLCAAETIHPLQVYFFSKHRFYVKRKNFIHIKLIWINCFTCAGIEL